MKPEPPIKKDAERCHAPQPFRILLEERERARPRLTRGVCVVRRPAVVHERMARTGVHVDVDRLAGLRETRLQASTLSAVMPLSSAPKCAWSGA
jgi:hypothetical protein